MIKYIAIRLFSRFVDPYIDYFDSLRFQLKQAQMKVTTREYLCELLLFSVIAFIVLLIVGSFFITAATTFIFYSYTLSIIISMAAALATFMIGYYYPTIKAKNLQNKIKKELPFSTVYMSTAASSHVSPIEMFNILSRRKGEIAKEAKIIYRDAELLGINISTAIANAGDRTPSPELSDLFQGIISIITRGGDLAAYLSEKSKEFMNDYRRSLNDYSRQVSFYTEIYVTLIIVGTLFFIVLSSIMGPLSGGNILMLQTFLVFFFVPLTSIGFIFLLKGLSPTE